MERIFETPPPSFEGMIRKIIRAGLPEYVFCCRLLGSLHFDYEIDKIQKKIKSRIFQLFPIRRLLDHFSYRARVESWFDENDSSSRPEYPLPRLSKGFQVESI